MLKHGVGKGCHVMKQLHVCLRMLQHYATVATERMGYVLYRALVIYGMIEKLVVSNFRQRLSHVYAINGNKKCTWMECGTLTPENLAKLKQYYFHAEF